MAKKTPQSIFPGLLMVDSSIEQQRSGVKLHAGDKRPQL